MTPFAADETISNQRVLVNGASVPFTWAAVPTRRRPQHALTTGQHCEQAGFICLPKDQFVNLLFT